MEQLLARLPPGECFFWATQFGAEIDLLARVEGKAIGFEFKVSDVSKPPRSMRIACEDLDLHRLLVVSPSSGSYPLPERVDVVSLPEAIARTCA